MAMETKDMFDNAFRFLETTFGDSQELVIFVTEITRRVRHLLVRGAVWL